MKIIHTKLFRKYVHEDFRYLFVSKVSCRGRAFYIREFFILKTGHAKSWAVNFSNASVVIKGRRIGSRT
jgi:hypothetical protein